MKTERTAQVVAKVFATRGFKGTAAATAIAVAMAAHAGVLDYFGPPPVGDPSAYTDQPGDVSAALIRLFTLPETNQGAYELPNGQYSSKTQQRTGNALSVLSDYNYPTNGNPSPMFGAQPFAQKLLMFEEFGVEKLDPTTPPPTINLPPPSLGAAPQQDPELAAASSPNGADLDSFLGQKGIAPFPTEYANTSATNPWKAQIESFLNRFLNNPPAEGRPPGEGWAHQRWHEFYPQTFFKTVQTGARVNNGLRDSKQLHGYAVGEFGPGGLYHNTAGATSTEGTTKGISIRIHPSMPVQNHNSVWTFDGTLPPKLLMVRYGQPVLMRHYNALPIDPAANRGFGLHTISTHEHNGHSPAESDGYANAFFFPGQFYDYRWPLQLAGYDTINTTASDPRAAFPCSPGETLWVNDMSPGPKTCNNGRIQIRGDWRETMSTHWFHDHMLDFTAQNVYKGNAVMMNYYSALDRGNESVNDGVNLRLPSGAALPWGNRDYDVNLVVGDKAWDKDGQLWFNPFNTDGFIGDRLLVNWQYAPYLDVRARRYRFRLLNGSVSRYLALAMVQQVTGSSGELPGPRGSGVSYNRVPFHLVANDGNIMEHAVPFDGTMDLAGDGNPTGHKGRLPTQGIAERYDIVVDFSKFKPGDKLYFVNAKEHVTGIGSNQDIPLADILSETYKAVLVTASDGTRHWDKGDPTVGRFMELRVQAYTGTDLSMNPADYEPGRPGAAEGKKMIPLWLDRTDPAQMAKLDTALHREFEFGRSNGTDLSPWTIKTDGGGGYAADMRRISAASQLATGPTDAGYAVETPAEVWTLKTGGGWSHPVHVHFEEGIILQRGGVSPPAWERWARKDVYRIGSEPDSTSTVQLAIRFREFAGTYMEHCHNTQHEDNSMLLRWDIEHPGQFQVMPTPLPTWDGVTYVASVGLPTFRTGMVAGNDGALGDAGGGATAIDPATLPFSGDAALGIEPATPLREMVLRNVPVPGPDAAALAEFIADKASAIQLGKALFWETRVGSDNKTACASCHSQAGADTRVSNQISPGLLRKLPGTFAPSPDTTFQVRGPNTTLLASDFPFTRFTNTFTNDPALRTDVNDVVSSQGVFNGGFVAVDTTSRNVLADTCTYSLDPDGFHNGPMNTRRVPPRNAPSVINAVFNFRNFWDGRANNLFNGGDPFGARNPNAMVWKQDGGAGLQKVAVALPSSSLAAQSAGPPLSGTEMSCSDRTFVQIGQKLLGQQILANQTVAASDSVLGQYAKNRPTYGELVRKAFKPGYWASPLQVRVTGADAAQVASMDLDRPHGPGKPLDLNVSHMEANFALFFGLAIQLYESTLVSDDTRFDRYAAGDTTALTADEQAGFGVFRSKARCASCHGGAELTNASARNVQLVRLERMDLRNGVTKTYDNGFYNIGVRPTTDDLGLGGRDPFGRPLSESMFLAEAADKEAAAAVLGNGFVGWKYIIPAKPSEVNVNGSFKTPGLRNVELTGPYFHNGGKATLMQVVDHYNRGGDFGLDNVDNVSTAIMPLGLSETDKTNLVSFMLALTDQRVRMEQAPFDHPSICLTNGHPASAFTSPSGLNAADDMTCLDAVGAEGRATPLKPFLGLSPYQH